MNLYSVTIEYGYQNHTVPKTVLAKTAQKAIDHALRYAKRNYWSDPKVIELSVVSKVDIFYKTD